MILKTEEALRNQMGVFRELFAAAAGTDFWRRHFENQGFRFEPAKFSWQYWPSVPFSSKEDFLKIGLEPRLFDAVAAAKSIYNLIFRITAGTSGRTEPLLLIRGINAPRKIPEGEQRAIYLYNNFFMGLYGAVLNIIWNKKEGGGRNQMLIIETDRFSPAIAEAVADFKADNFSAYPNTLAQFASALLSFPNSDRSAVFGIGIADLSGDFLSPAQLRLIQECFPGVRIRLKYGMADFGGIGQFCPFLKDRYAFNAYHPRADKYHLIELVDLDEQGYGEIVATRLRPVEFSAIRYRTGDMGRAIFETCACGAKVTLFLMGRKDADYVKCAGTLILRNELERVLQLTEAVEDWRAEAREKVISKKLIGELKINIKPRADFLNRLIDRRSYLTQSISENLFLTPTDTLADLVLKQKFMPLQLEFVDEFPKTQKRVLLRKVS